MTAPPRLALLVVLAACNPSSSAPAPRSEGVATPDTKAPPLLTAVPVAPGLPPRSPAGEVEAGPAWRRYVAVVNKAPAAACPPASDGWAGERLFRSGEVA